MNFSLRWWQVPRNMYLLCIGGSFAVIGVLWPLLLSVMVKLGWIAPREAGIDLRHVKSTSEVAMPAAVGVTMQDRDQLDALNDQLQANVAGMAVDAAPGAGHDERAEQKIRDLPNAAQEAAPLVNPAKEADEYQGEYYPVVKPSGKKN